MKLCPVCNSLFSDDTFKYCLIDRTELIEPSQSGGSAQAEEETVEMQMFIDTVAFSNSMNSQLSTELHAEWPSGGENSNQGLLQCPTCLKLFENEKFCQVDGTLLIKASARRRPKNHCTACSSIIKNRHAKKCFFCGAVLKLPKIDNLCPVEGDFPVPAAGGTRMRITGSNFGNPVTMLQAIKDFPQTIPIASAELIDEHTIEFVTPPARGEETGCFYVSIADQEMQGVMIRYKTNT